MKKVIAIALAIFALNAFAAISATKKRNTVFGNMRVEFYDLTFTSVTGGVIVTGLDTVVHAAYSPTTSDDHGIVYHNYSDAGSTSARGQVFVDSVTSGDTGKLMVIGK